MKNKKEKQNNSNPLLEIEKEKNFSKYYKEAQDRIRLAVEIYNSRKKLGLSQQELAKKAKTTQKIISKIENADVNIGFDLLNKIADSLKFDCNNWSNIFKFSLPPIKVTFNSQKTEDNTKNKQKLSTNYLRQ